MFEPGGLLVNVFSHSVKFEFHVLPFYQDNMLFSLLHNVYSENCCVKKGNIQIELKIQTNKIQALYQNVNSALIKMFYFFFFKFQNRVKQSKLVNEQIERDHLRKKKIEKINSD